MWTNELLQDLKNNILPKFNKEIFALNDDLARHPELGSSEYESSAKIVKLLKSHGIATEYPFADIPTAFKAIINPGKAQKCAILVEYDALPDIGHACGHCASGAASIMTALALNEVADAFDVQFDIIGTPDEELQGKKCDMATMHIFDAYDFAVMVHMGGINTIDVEFIALDGMTIKYKGAPSHAAQAPEKGRNALNAARLFFDAVDMMRQHIIPEARLHGYIKNGGVASNIVPDYTEIEFLTRAPKRKDLSEITAWVHDIANAAALATHTEVEISPLGAPFHDLYISQKGREVLAQCYSDLNLPLTEGKGNFVGSSDMGNVDYVCPAFHPIMSIGKPYACHTREFAEVMTHDDAHIAIENSARLILTLIFKLYGNPSLLDEVKAQHKAYRGY